MGLRNWGGGSTIRAANESSSSELKLAQLNSYENSSELKLSETQDRAVEHDLCSACNDLESISI